MAVGDSTWTIKGGSGQVRVTSQQLSRSVVHMGVSPLGTPNALYPVSSDTDSLLGLLDYCELSEVCAFTGRGGLTKYALVLNPTTPGAVAALVHTGQGAGTVVLSCAPHKQILVKVATAGALATAAFKFSLDGGVTWSANFLSTAGPYAIRVPGTYCTLTFAAAVYVIDKTLTVDTDGTVTPGSGWVGVVTQASSPLDDYEPLITINKDGALGVTSIQASLDAGNSVEIGDLLTPAGGVVVIPNTGLVFTLAGTFDAGDTYSFLAKQPTPTTSDITNAMTAAKANPALAASLFHLASMPSSAAGAMSAANTIESELEDGFSNDAFDWRGISDCPSNKGGTRLTSAITTRKQQRPSSWLWVDRYVDTDPKMELAAKAAQGDADQGAFRAFVPAGATGIVGNGDIVISGGAPIYDTADTDAVITAARGVDLNRVGVCVGGRDEKINPGLDSAQFNTLRTYKGPLAVYGSISKGTAGWKMLSTNAAFIDGALMRVVDTLVAGMRPLAEDELGQDYDVNPDGTITSGTKKLLDTKFDTAAKLILGMLPGGDFVQKQASFVSAEVLATSQLGQAPKRLDFAYKVQGRGKVTDANSSVLVSGKLSVTQS